MECAEIRSDFAAGRVPAGPALDAHLQSCVSCRDLFVDDALLGRRLAEAVLPPPPAGDLFQALDQRLAEERGVRASLRAWPTWLRVSLLVGVALLLTGWHLLHDRRIDFGHYSQPLFWALALALLAALAVGVWGLARGVTAPLVADQRLTRRSGLLLLLPAVIALLSPLGIDLSLLSEADRQAGAAWNAPSICFGYGAALVTPFLVLAWLFERRERVPVSTLVGVGALAGIAANLLLHAHCSCVHLGHLLLGHASIGVAWALGLGLLAGRFQRSG